MPTPETGRRVCGVCAQLYLEKEVRRAKKAGYQEGGERIIAILLDLIEMAEMDKEMADDPDDPKIRIKWLKDFLLRIDI